MSFRDLTITSPCPGPLPVFEPGAATTFCDGCNKVVFDTAAMTPAEVGERLEAGGGSVCAKIARRRDGSIRFAAAFALGSGLAACAPHVPPTACSLPTEANAAHDIVSLPAGTAQIRVTDDSGLEIPGVLVRLVGGLGGLAREALSNAEGVATFDELPGGSYQVVVQKIGFNADDAGIVVGESGAATIVMRFDSGDMGMVTVGAFSSLINTETVEQSTTFSEDRLRKIP